MRQALQQSLQVAPPLATTPLDSTESEDRHARHRISNQPRSEAFKASEQAMLALVQDLEAKLAQIALGGGEGPRAKHLVPRQVAAA